METVQLTISQENSESLEVYSKLLHKDVNTILNEALKMYFEKAQEHLQTKSLEGDGANTNLDFNEFWDGLDVE